MREKTKRVAALVLSVMIIFSTLGALPRTAFADSEPEFVILQEEVFDGTDVPVTYIPYVLPIAENILAVSDCVCFHCLDCDCEVMHSGAFEDGDGVRGRLGGCMVAGVWLWMKGI